MVLSPLALSRPLTSTTLHFLRRKVAQITTGHGIAALHMALFPAESELFVLLLAFRRGSVAVFAAAFVTGSGGLGCVVDGNVEEVLGVIGWAGGVCLALCKRNID